MSPYTRILVSLSLTALLLLNYSCSTDEKLQPQRDTSFVFQVKNNSNQDLLDPNIPTSLNTEDLKLIDIKNGDRVEVKWQNSNHPNGYIIDKPGDNTDYRMRIYPKIAQHATQHELIIQWNSSNEEYWRLEFSPEQPQRLLRIIINDTEVAWEESQAINPSYRNFTLYR